MPEYDNNRLKLLAVLFAAVSVMLFWANGMIKKQVDTAMTSRSALHQPEEYKDRTSLAQRTSQPSLPVIDPKNDPLAPESRKNPPSEPGPSENIREAAPAVYEIPSENVILIQ